MSKDLINKEWADYLRRLAARTDLQLPDAVRDNLGFAAQRLEASEITEAKVEAAALALINQTRADHELPPLTWNAAELRTDRPTWARRARAALQAAREA